MAKVNGEIVNQEFDIEINVLEYEIHETPSSEHGKKAIVDLNLGFNFPSSITPHQLREIGEWLIKQSDIINREFTIFGKNKKK